MKNTLHLLLASLVITLAGQVAAQTSMVPSAMNYQGVLTDASGNVVAPTAPANQNVEFRIYSQASGGTALWGEAQTVTVFKGNFSVILGNGTALAGVASSGPAAFASVFTNAASADLFFGITPVGGPEFAPRQKLLSSAFALRAKTAEAVNASGQAANTPSLFNALAANNVTLNGPTKISGANVMEFGFGVANKEESAGSIGYNVYSTPGLSIVGGGETVESRKLTLWAEGGTDFKGPISFGSGTGQRITLSSAGPNVNFGIGVAVGTHYFRTEASTGSFRWYQGGSHSDDALNSTNGTSLMLLDSNGLTLPAGRRFIGDGSGLTNVPVPTTAASIGMTGSLSFGGRNGQHINLWNTAHGIGIASNTTYFRTAPSTAFRWYLGGTHNDDPANVANGTQLLALDGSGLTVPTNTLNFGSRTGQLINLYGGTYGIGVANSTTYFRTTTSAANGAFRWYQGGVHNDNAADPSQGTSIATLSSSGFSSVGSVTAAGNVVAGGNVTIGGNTLTFPNQNNWGIAVGSDFQIMYNGSARATIAGTGPSSGQWTFASDRKLKQDIKPLTGALSGILALKPSTYHYKTEPTGTPSMGLIAQEVQEVYPQLVNVIDKKEGTLGVAYEGLIPVAVAAVQEQQKQIESLSDENTALKKRLEALEARMSKFMESPPETAKAANASETVNVVK
jgi:hypothetical protein